MNITINFKKKEKKFDIYDVDTYEEGDSINFRIRWTKDVIENAVVHLYKSPFNTNIRPYMAVTIKGLIKHWDLKYLLKKKHKYQILSVYKVLEKRNYYTKN